MNKSKYGKLSIIFILIATLCVSAAIAIFGLTTNKGTGANDLSAEITAPEKEASSAIVDGEVTDDGEISVPEVETKAAATYTGWNNWSTAVASSGNTLYSDASGDTLTNRTFTVPAGITLTLHLQSSWVFSGNSYIVVNGTLNFTATTAAQYIRAAGTGTYDTLIYVNNGGTLNLNNGTINGNNLKRGVLVNSGGTFNMNGGTITTGKNSYGGGVYNYATFNMSGGTITGCKAEHGAGVYQQAGTFKMTGGTISSCTQSAPGWKGGGVAICGGKFEMSGSSTTITGNSGTYGGGVFVDGGSTFTMSSGEIEKNTASEAGGGVYIDSSSTFNKNGGYIGHEGQADGNSAPKGGGVAVFSGTFTMGGGEIDVNSATSSNGGGVWIGGTTTFTLNSGYIDGNNAKTYGGGVYIDGTSAKFEMKGGYIGYGSYPNNANSRGGGVYNTGTFNMSAGTIQKNTTKNTSGTLTGYGGGVYNTSTFKMTGGNINDNSSEYGGGIYSAGGTFSVTGTSDASKIYSNSATTSGGGIYMSSGTNTLSAGKIYKNSAKYGGGIVWTGGTLDFAYVTVGGSTDDANTASEFGGGVYVTANGTFSPAYCSISYNTATNGGGGVYVNGSSSKININQAYANITNNKATASDSKGGGVYVKSGTSFTLSSGTIQGNSAAYGGGVFIEAGTFTMSGGTIGGSSTNKNSAGTSGGGVYLKTSGTCTFSDGTISYNSAVSGGGVYVELSTATTTFTMSKATGKSTNISNNSAGYSGAGVYVSSGKFSHTGGDIKSNSAAYLGGNLCIGGGTYEQNGTDANVYNGTAFNGGGVYVSGGTYELKSGRVGNSVTSGTTTTNYGNTSYFSGAGVYVTSGTFKMSGGSVNYNKVDGCPSYTDKIGGGGVGVVGGTVTISGGTIGYNNVSNSQTSTPGYTGSEMGGGVYVTGGTVTMSAGTITSNTISVSGRYGGGVYVGGGTFTMSGGSIVKHSLNNGKGGGVGVGGGTFEMTGGTIGGSDANKNTVTDGGGQGGGVYVAGGTATTVGGTFKLSGGTISYNTAPNGSGGGVYVGESGVFSMSTGYIYNSTAYNGGGLYLDITTKGEAKKTGGYIGQEGSTDTGNKATNYGGGVYIKAGTFEHSGGEIDLNKANSTTTGYGGGVFVSSGSTFKLSGGWIDGNIANHGGGVYSDGTFELDGGNIGHTSYHNVAYTRGGGVGVGGSGTFTMKSGTISYNDVKDTTGAYAGYGGGVVLLTTCTFTMEGGTIKNNKAAIGGGIYKTTSTTATIKGGTIGGSSATYANEATTGAGGGVYVASGTLNMEGGTIGYNTAKTTGGGVYIASGTKFALSSTGAINGNTATTTGGGVHNAGTLEITGGSIGADGKPNTATQGGGGVCSSGTFTMSGGAIRYNKTGDGYAGGGVRVNGSTFTMTGGSIHNNEAKAAGGGVYVNAGTFSVSGTSTTKSLIYSNTAGTNGGGICTNTGTTITVGDYTEVYSNTATQGGGGIYSNVALTINKANTKIYSNTGKQDGGGIYQNSGKLTVSNGYIYSNDTLITNKSYGRGGGIYANADVEISGGYIYSNTSIYGGGVYMANATITLTMKGGYIGRSSATSTTTGNTADRNGGGVYIQASATFTKTGGYIEYNKALGSENTDTAKTYGFGGGVACIGTMNMTTNAANYIRYNTAVAGGGVAFYGTSKTFTFSAGTIGNNTVTCNGGGVILCTNSPTLAMSDSAIISSNTAALDGGGVYMTKGTFNFSKGTISSNQATGDSSGGGGVFISGGTLTMTGGNINNNTAKVNGGGIRVNGSDATVSISGTSTTPSKIFSNTTNTGVVSYGGGISLYAAKSFTIGEYTAVYSNTSVYGGGIYSNIALTINKSTTKVYSNTATRNGGGVYAVTNFTFSAGAIYGNETTLTNFSYGLGGGVFVGGGTFTMSSVTASGVTTSGSIYKNKAIYGGGMLVNGTTTVVNMSAGTIGGSEENKNTAVRNGGGVYINPSATFNMSGGTISYNEALNTDSANPTSYGWGGGVAINGGKLNMTDANATISYNKGTVGAGIALYSSGTVTLTAGKINNNTAKRMGGGVYMSAGTFTMNGDNAVISGNSATDTSVTTNERKGGGVYVAGGTVNMSKGTIGSSNVAYYGGGVYVGGDTFNMTGGNISGNLATSNTTGTGGGGVYVGENGTFKQNGDKANIYNNDTYGYGGGVYNCGTYTFTKGTIGGSGTGNESYIRGGGVYNSGSKANFTLEGGTISYNTTVDPGQMSGTFAGAGVYVESGTFTMKSGSISNNSINNTMTTYPQYTGTNAGGGLYLEGGTFSMQGGTVSNNSVGSGTSYGGGVYVGGGAFTLSGSGTIGSNSAQNGGGVAWMGGTFTMSGGTIGGGTSSTSNTGNSASYYGGGVYVGGALNFAPTGGTISYNKVTSNSTDAGQYGGAGVCINNSSAKITLANANVIISDNSVSGSKGSGGGVYVKAGEFTMSNGYIRSNSAAYGGGVYIGGSSKFTLSGGTIGGSTSSTSNTGNTASSSGYGGGVYLKTTGECKMTGGTISYNGAYSGAGIYITGTETTTTTLSLSGGTIDNNTCTGWGGGVYVQGEKAVLTMTGGTISGNGKNLWVGGGVYVNGGTFNMSNGTISGNDGNYAGGGVYLASGTFNLSATSTISGNVVKSNSSGATLTGAGVAVADGTFNMTGGTISENCISATSTYKVPVNGGGVYTSSSGTFNLSGGSIIKNTADNGGGVYTSGSGTFNMTGGTIGGSAANANAAINGAGVYLASTTEATFSAGTISYNTATGATNTYGGGVYINAGATLNMSGAAIVSYNSAKYGAGIYLNGAETTEATLNLSGGHIYKNAASSDGGGIGSAGAKAVIEMTGGTIGGTGSTYANTASSGAGVYSTGKFTVSDGTIAYNTATSGGGGVFSSGELGISGTAEISNNTADGGGGLIINGSSAQATVSGGKIINNKSGECGGGILLASGNITMSGGLIDGNIGGWGGAGGVLAYGGTFEMSGGTISNNTTTANGGGVYIANTAQFTLSGGEITANTAANGLGVYVQGGTFTIKEDGAITANVPASGATVNGAGVYVAGGTLNVNGGTISENEAALGGGIYVAGGTANVAGGEITANEATNGAGAYVAGGTLNVSGGEISENEATLGGGIYVAGGKASVTGGEIKNNTAATTGGGAYVKGGVLEVTGGKITENVAEKTYGAGVYLDGGKLQLGNTPYIYGNTYLEKENNVFITTAESVTFSDTLESGAKVGLVYLSKEEIVLTDGFTAAGHTEEDIEKYFVCDVRGTTLKYVDEEVVIKYDIVYAWNETIRSSIDNEITENFMLFFDWEPENGSFGSGIGFTGLGVILVPENASVIFDFNGYSIDRKETEGSAMRVEGTLVLDAPEGGSIKGGNAEHGGALYIYGGNVTLKNATLCDNTASYGGAVFIDNSGEFTMEGGSIVRNTAENGGAIYVKEGEFTINGGVIGGSAANKNEATSYGGAIYVAGGGVVTIEDGTISYNEALSGGAIYVAGGRFNVTNGLINNNTASENGGAVYVDSGVVTVDGGEISQNGAENGGNVYVAGGNVTFSDGVIEFSTATLGGGVYVAGGTVTVDGGDITGNNAENGAGVYVTGGSLIISDGLIAGNTATENGGGVYVTGNTTQFTLSGGRVVQNYAKAGLGVYVNGGTATVTGEGAIQGNRKTSVNGAGVYLENGTLNVTGGEISANEATNGGAVYVAGGTLAVSGGEIKQNTANNGGGVYATGGTINMTNGAIAGNVAPNGGGVYVGGESTFNLSGGAIGVSGNGNMAQYGGGVYVEGGSFNMTGGTVAYNDTSIYYGGGVYIGSGTFTMSDGTISNNTAYITGGGVYAAGGSFEMTDGTISNNTTSHGNGGGVYVGGTFTMDGGKISGNTAESGGGVYNSGSFEMTDGEISANSAQKGAGVYVASNKTFDFSAGEIKNNTATGATTTYGGGVYVDTNAELNVSGEAEITGNTATLGGGVYVEGTLDITAGAISENSASSGGGVYIKGGSAEMTGGEITNNSSTDASVGAGGGGVYVAGGDLTVSGSAKINENSAVRYGGGIRVDGSTDSASVEMTDGFLNGNTATYGGGAYVSGNFAYLVLTDTATVSDNEASTAGGGAAVANGATIELEGHAYITKNTAELNGGGVYVSDDGELIVREWGAITYNTADNGGGVYVMSNGEFVMESGSLSYNEVTSNGGAAYVSGATFTLEGGRVLGNTAENGGAVYVAANAASAFNMNGGVIGGEEDDEANAATLGGGLYVAGGTATLTSGEIKYNTATENGAGVYFNAGTLAIKGNPVISDNTFQNTPSNLYLFNGKTITVVGKLTEGAYIGVTGNGKLTDGYTANDNGDDEKAYFVGDVAGAVIVINVGELYIQISLENAWNAAVQASLDKGGKPATFVLAEIWRATDGSFNEEGGVGFTADGALYLPQGAYVILNLNGYSINRNLTTATETGSVIYIDGTLEIAGTAGYITGGNSENGGGIYVNDGGLVKLTVGNIQDNTATENGGGVYVASGARFEMTGGAIRGNSAKNGGAVYVEANGEFTISGGTIGGTNFENTATENGGAVYSEGSFTMAGGTVTLNAATQNGGAVYVAGGECSLADGTVSKNTAENGAGVYVAGGKFTLDGATITQNAATENGGGVYVASGATFEQVDGVISNNNAINGGGVYVNGGTYNLSGGYIRSNTASKDGGGVYVASGTFSMTGGTIGGSDYANTATANGGGVYTKSTTAATFSAGTISYNTAGYGGGVYIEAGGRLDMSGTAVVANNGASTHGGGIRLNGSTEKEATLNLSGGQIYNNTATQVGGGIGAIGSKAVINMTGGEISDNTAIAGGGVYSTGTAVLNGGKITSNTGNNTAGGVYNSGTLTVSGTVEISGNSTNSSGGGITTDTTNGKTTIDGGLISGNTANAGGGVYATNGGNVVMNDGEISGNEATRFGGGVYVANGANNASFEMNGGKICGNSSDIGSGVFLSNGTVKITDGEISGNTGISGAGVYLSGGKGVITGGKITGNSVTGGAGGMFVESGAIFEIEGSPMIYGNTANGEESNVYLVANKTITVTGMLSANGKIAYVGVTMADPSKKKFTSGFAANNTDYDPDLLPATVFFSDDTNYMVSLENGEAVLVENDYSQTSLVWQLSKDGENTWISIDVPTFTLRYKTGETYAVRALDSAGEEVTLTWAAGESGDIDARNFSGIGSYKFVVNSNGYLNPALTVEILPATLYWQYSADEGRTWLDLTGDTMVYTGAEYKVRAIVYNPDNENGYEEVQTFNDTMKDVGGYEYTVTNVNLYENPTLNFSITTRYITVEWNFGDALGNETDGYYWDYDGLVHTPIAVLNGVSNELAGVDLSYGYDWSGGQSFASASAYAGTYTLTVGLKQADDNIVLSNTTVEYKINGVTLTLTFVDENGNEGDEFTFEYDSETHGVDFILNGVVTGDNVGAYITYASRSGKILSEAPSAVGYYTATVKLPADCYNYVFDRTYICEIVITSKTLQVQWQPNTDGTYEWTFNGLGKAPVASIINPYTGEEINEAYKIDYAPVASNGHIGRYSTTQPVNAGNYIVRLTLTNPDANFVLDEDTTKQLFTINKLDVTVTWKGATYDADKDVYYWSYDGNEHDLEAEISLVGMAVNKDGVIIDSLGIERTDAQTKLVSVGSATATVVLLNDPFNANFNITNSTSQVYEVRKAVITAVEWTDKLNQKFASSDTPEYDFGSVSGVNGPAFVATALDGAVTLVVTYNKSYAGDWVVDETNGYTAYARLSAADAINYEFAGDATYATITFKINSVGGYKTDIDVTWVVFINEHEYVTLDQYLDEGGFVYNGKVQNPTPIYLKDNGIDYEVLDLQQSSIGADAGTYTARLKPSSVYNIKEEDFTCNYEIKKLGIVVSWQNGRDDSSTTFSYVYSGSEQAPYAYVAGTYDFPIDITVNGKINAGSYVATAVVSNNFRITSGKTQVYSIEKKGLSSGLIKWDYVGAGASGDASDGWYWIYDGKEHAPIVTIPAANWGGEFDIELVVTGKTSEIGTHTAYAVLNSSIAAHNNFYLTGTAETTFEIVQVKAGKVYWEDESGHTYEDGKGGNTGLVFTYNGETEGQKPKAYYLDEDGEKVYLTVTVIGGTAVGAGTYTAYVSSELDFESALPTCTFNINAMEITVDWDGDTTLTFNGTAQHPAVTLSNGAADYELEEGVDYEVTSFVKAGKYTAEIKFINTNYTCADDAKTFEFEIEKVNLSEIDGENITEGFVWDTTGYDEESDTYVWTYDGDNHNPVLTVTYTIDGEEVVFEIGYAGAASAVGKHKVTAYIKSATIGDEDITESFILEAEMEYEIVSVSVSIDWDWGDALTGTDENGNEYHYWSYDGTKHAPKAYLKDAEGNRIKDDEDNEIELDVYGGEINARDDAAYTLTAVVPSEYNFTGDNTQKYFIKKATIEVVWDFGDNAEYDEETGVYSWTYGDEVEPKAYIKVTSTDEEGNVTVTKGAELTVTGIETDAGTHTLTVMHSDGNYKFASDSEATQAYVINAKKVYVIWYGNGGIENEDTTNFEWTYGGENTVPSAYLAYKDQDGNLQLILDENGDAIKVEVSGASNEIGTHTAQVVDTFVNYEFADGADVVKEFTINKKEATGFKWTAEGAKVSEDGSTFTYEYSGKNNLPVPSSDIEDLAFNVKIEKTKDDGSTEIVLAITEVGTYKVTATSQNGNYKIPDNKEEILVIVTKKTVKAEWDESELVYNGENQKPKAYYEDVDGNKIELDVSVKDDYANVGEIYTAIAALNSANYALDPSTETFEFEITAKTIHVTWGESEFNYDGSEHAPLPTIVLTSAEKDGIEKVVYEITDKDGNVVAGTNEDDKKVVNAGEYTVKVWLEGPAASNYKLDKDEFTFNVYQKVLTITAADKEVPYGNSLNLTLSDVTIEGLIESDEELIKEQLENAIANWLSCHYAAGLSLPGTYTIYVDASWLNENLLDNYTVTGVNGTLTVKPAAGVLIWKAEKYDEEGTPVFTYNGEAKLPQAFYYDARDNKVPLNVKLATLGEDGEYVVTDGEAVNASETCYYAVIVDNEGNVIKGHGSYQFDNFGSKFLIEKREIVINLNELKFTYGDENVTEEHLADLLVFGRGWTYGETEPVAGDVLGITLTINGTFDEGGYLVFVEGGYDVTVGHDEAYDGNYTFVIEGEQKLIVEKAVITVKDYDGIYANDEDVYTVYDDNGILKGTEGYISDFVTKTKDFLNIAGYQDAEVEVKFSECFDADGEIPDINGYRFMGDEVEKVFAEGKYVYFFKIVIPNHETLLGQLIVDVKYDDYYLSLEIVKDTLTEEYGYAAPEDLAIWLIENGYAKYDEEVNAAVSKDTFLSWVTATVYDENGEEATGKLNVGTYKVVFGLSEDADDRYSIYKATSRTVAIEITKCVIDIDWGNEDNLNYTYDGETHMPVITVAGLTDENGNPVTLKVGENEIIVNGEPVKVLVTVDGEFTEAGAYSVLITVDSENFEISEDGSLRSVSITEPLPVIEKPVPGVGIEDWKLWLIIAAAIVLAGIIIAIVVAAVKRRKIGDEDGFYDDVAESDL